jgi:hypothetical protein
MIEAFSIGISILTGGGTGNGIVFAIISGMQNFQVTKTNLVIPIIAVSVLVITAIIALLVYNRSPKWLLNARAKIKTIFSPKEVKKVTGNESFDSMIASAGYSYDAIQDIFYSNMDAWQRDMGYCRLYDEAAAPLGMIIDCEPIDFEYEGKKWLIELWKGQYDLTMGCEVGVYTSDKPALNIPGVFNGSFYESASDSDQLVISYTLKKNNKTLFTRKGRHWWLTGFKLGEFAEPSELCMYVNITLKDEKMRNEFVNALKKIGYTIYQIIIYGNTVSLKFDKAHTRQPYTRIPETDWIIQRKNEKMCETYQEITKPYKNFPDKIKAIQEQAPELYGKVINIGKTKQFFGMYEKIKDYLD